MDLSHERPMQRYGLLYPIMLIAAIAVIVFSIVGIATVVGWMPTALSATAVTFQPEALGEAAGVLPAAARSGAAFECAECGMIETIREIERQGTLTGLQVEATSINRL